MNDVLPAGWKRVKLRSAASLLPTGVPNYDGRLEYYSTGSIKDTGNQAEGKYSFSERPSRANRQSKEMDVFQARMQGTNKPLLIVGALTGKLFSTGFLQIRAIEGVSKPNYLYYYVSSPDFLQQRDLLATGSTQVALTDSKADELYISLAPLNEQLRIVGKLDKVLARVRTGQQRLANVPRIMKRFRRSVLVAACSGKLTADWRAKRGLVDDDLPAAWRVELFGDLATDIQNGIYKPQSSYGVGTAIVRIEDFYDGQIAPRSELKMVRLTPQEVSQYALRNGQVLVNRVNSMKFLGKVGLVKDLDKDCVYESNMMRVDLNSSLILPEYATIFLISPNGVGQLKSNAKHAVNQSSINQGDVKAVEVMTPPLDEQEQIVSRVKALFAFADSIEQRLSSTERFVDKLTGSVLAKAFRGELVSNVTR